jgi:hypothetical protein
MRAAMEGFDHVLNWKLQQGSHRFPGEDGGTCINEAALVAAGFDYKPIACAEDMPACFSRPICRFALKLNDEANDQDRQRLLPFVTRLACADTPEIERARATYIGIHAYRFMSVDHGLHVLEGALAIGRQADPFAADEVQTRMDAVRAHAPTASPAAAEVPPSILSKMRSWFGLREVEPTG